MFSCNSYFQQIHLAVLLKNENAHTKNTSLENLFIMSKRSPKFIEASRGKEFLNKVVSDF